MTLGGPVHGIVTKNSGESERGLGGGNQNGFKLRGGGGWGCRVVKPMDLS